MTKRKRKRNSDKMTIDKNLVLERLELLDLTTGSESESEKCFHFTKGIVFTTNGNAVGISKNPFEGKSLSVPANILLNALKTFSAKNITYKITKTNLILKDKSTSAKITLKEVMKFKDEDYDDLLNLEYEKPVVEFKRNWEALLNCCDKNIPDIKFAGIGIRDGLGFASDKRRLVMTRVFSDEWEIDYFLSYENAEIVLKLADLIKGYYLSGDGDICFNCNDCFFFVRSMDPELFPFDQISELEKDIVHRDKLVLTWPSELINYVKNMVPFTADIKSWNTLNVEVLEEVMTITGSGQYGMIHKSFDCKSKNIKFKILPGDLKICLELSDKFMVETKDNRYGSIVREKSMLHYILSIQFVGD